MSLIGKKLFVAVAPATIISLEVAEVRGVSSVTGIQKITTKLSGRNNLQGVYLFNKYSGLREHLNMNRQNVFSEYKLAREYLLIDLEEYINKKEEELEEALNLIKEVSAL